MATRVYRSEDEGRSWRYLSEVRAANPGGVWEPEFTVDREGALVLFFSDDAEAAEHSQTLKKGRTNDGLNWRDRGYVVASKARRDRPGMAVTQRLADGRWMMTYELGGPARFIVYYRLADDGWNWGDPANVGLEIRLPDRAFPARAPRFTVMPDGAILLVAQLIETPELKLGARNGRLLLVNRAGNPAASWGTIPAPVPGAGRPQRELPPNTNGVRTTPPRCFLPRTGWRCWSSLLTGRVGSALPPMLGGHGAPMPDLARNNCGAPEGDKEMADPTSRANNPQTGDDFAAVYEATAHRIAGPVSNIALDLVGVGPSGG